MQKISLSLILLGAVGAESCYDAQIAFAFDDVKTVKDITHPDNCQQECAALDECHFYTYFPETQHCVLKGKDAMKSAYFLKGAFSGPKQCCEQQCNHGYVFTNVDMVDPDECRLQCYANADCKKHMWTQESGCTLKVAIEEQVSAAKRCCGMDCAPPLLSPCLVPLVAYMDVTADATLKTETLADCSKACDKDPNCEVFTFHKDGRCWLAEMTAAKYKNNIKTADIVSGRKNCCVSKDLEYQGRDYMDISGIDSAHSCRSECLIREACVAWNYKADTICNLKLTINGWVAAEGTASGSRMCCVDENMDYPGDDIHTTPIAAKTYQECQLECQKEDECKYFTWNTGGLCWLKRELEHYKRNASAVSGPKTCCQEVGIDFTESEDSTQEHSDDQICMKSCLDTDGCFMVAFNRTSKVCHHQEIIGKRFFGKDIASAVARC